MGNFEEDTGIEDMSEEGQRRRADDKIPSAYKLWLQTALNSMQTPPHMIADIKEAIKETNETLIHKINNNIQKSVGALQIELEQYKTEREKVTSGLVERITAIESQSKTLKWVFGVGAVIVAGSFTLVSVLA